MASPTRGVLFVACVVALALLAGQAAAAGPDVAVTADGESVADGGEVLTATEPDLEVSASVDENASSDVALEDVVVRIDSETRHTFDASGTQTTESFRPDLSEGGHTVRFIVTDTTGEVTSHEFSVSKDTLPPTIRLSEPYETSGGNSVGGGTVSGSETTFAGRVFDANDVRSITFTFDQGGENRSYSTSRSIDDPDGAFSTSTVLAPGVNNVTLVTRDELGNAGVYRFKVTVEDGGGPNLTLAPAPSTTTSDEFRVTGTATDDVWVDEVSLDIEREDENGTESRTLVASKPFDQSEDRRSVAFEEVVDLDVTNYTFTVTATDHSGETAEKTLSIERVAVESGAPAPEIRFNRQDALFVDERTVFVSTDVTGSAIDWVELEARDVDTGETEGFQIVHDGEGRARVEVRSRVDVGDGVSAVYLRAKDDDGQEHSTRFYVNASSERTFVGPDGRLDPGPAVRVNPLETGSSAAGSANVEVSGVESGSDVRVPAADSDRLIVAGTDQLAVQRLELSNTEPPNFTLYVRTETTQSVPSGFSSETNAAGVGSVSVDHSLPDAAFGQVTFRFRVADSYLSETGVEPGDVTLYRQHDGNWSELDTEHLDSSDGHHRYRSTAPGLSLFAVGSSPSAESSESETGNETDTDSEPAPEPEPSFSVTNVSLNRTRIVPNGTVGVNVTVENAGEASGTFEAGLALNDSVVARRVVAVDPGNETNVTIAHRVADAGNYSVAVGGTSGGHLLVKERGFLGGILHFLGSLVPDFVANLFAGLPLRLIGMALGAIVGVIVLISLGLRVLQRVQGSGEAG